MVNVITFPDADLLEKEAKRTPAGMYPNANPYALVLEGYLDDAQCAAIVNRMMEIKPYHTAHCGAVTRESDQIDVLDPIADIARQMNRALWDYDLSDRTISWMQTYRAGGAYPLHMDAAPGQTRKLTAVALLTDPRKYGGGHLELFSHPLNMVVPNTRGTIVVFQSHILHRVHEVFDGVRQTINMGFWGPPFK